MTAGTADGPIIIFFIIIKFAYGIICVLLMSSVALSGPMQHTLYALRIAASGSSSVTNIIELALDITRAQYSGMHVNYIDQNTKTHGNK